MSKSNEHLAGDTSTVRATQAGALVQGPTPRTDAFVDSMKPIVLPNLTRGEAVAIGKSVRDAVVSWSDFARQLESEHADLLAELQNLVNAKRFDVDVFDDDTAFVDWALSRARAAIAKARS